VQQLARQALDPVWKQTSFGVLAEKNKLNYHMVSAEYKAIMKSEGYIRQAAHLPELMEQSAIDAKSKWEECGTCDGAGDVPDNDAFTIAKAEARDNGLPAPVVAPRKRCKACKGTGKVYVEGNIDKLKMVFETHGLIGKGGGLNVNLDLRNPPVAPESMSDLAASVAPIIEGDFK